jgi:hypothetical protein
MFLYAKLVMTNLFEQTSKANVLHEMDASVFPKGLEDA